MSQAVTVLGRVEEEVSALLVAGLATQRGGRGQIEGLATEAAALKMERLAQDLRALARGQDPTALANSAFTVLAMARKLKERLIPWPEVTPEKLVPLSPRSPVRISLAEPLPDNTDTATLVHCMESGNDLVRAHAADLLVERGAEAIPELGRLAKSAPTAVRRDAIRTIGRIGGDAALAVLLGIPNAGPCWRALLEAVLPFGQKALPPLVATLESKPEKKHQERRRVAAALLYRLGAFEALRSAADPDGDAVEIGLGFAAAVRSGQTLEGKAGGIGRLRWDSSALGPVLVALAEAEASAETSSLLDPLSNGAVDELKLVGRWAVTGSPIEGVLAEWSLERTAGGNAKSRQRAVSFLCGLAYPPIVPPLTARLARDEIELVHAINILGEVGGSQAVGTLLDVLGRGTTVLETLEQVGDPGTAPSLLRILERGIEQGNRAPAGFNPDSIEHALASLGDGIAPLLGREMQARRGTPVAESIQRALLQMKGGRARNALKGSDTGSIDAIISRLGHLNVAQDAIKALVRKGDEAVAALETVAAQGAVPAAIDALGALDGIGTDLAMQSAQRALEQRLPRAASHWNAEARFCVEAINVLFKHRGAAAAPLLAMVLGASCDPVQKAAAKALIRIGPEAVALVVPVLDSPRASARAHALMVVGRLRVAPAEDKALALLGDADQQVRNAAATALGEICRVTGSPGIVDAIGKALMSGAFRTPYLVVQALGETGQRSAIPYLRGFAVSNPSSSYYVDQAIRKIEASSPSSSVSGIASRLKGLFGGRG